jgi:hypothetical protein
MIQGFLVLSNAASRFGNLAVLLGGALSGLSSSAERAARTIDFRRIC